MLTTGGIVALACVGLTLAMLVRGRTGSDIVMAGGIALLVLTGVLAPQEAFSGLASPSILTIALLLVISQGVIDTGLIQWIGPALFGRTRNVLVAQLRLMLPVAAFSGFINNTPLVAMCIPVVQDFSRRTRIAPGKLFIPLAFAATLGGVCTLIGTSTNLVVNEMWVKAGNAPFGLFDLSHVGIPVALAGIAYIAIAGRWLLPASGAASLAGIDPRSYAVEMRVTGAPVAGNTVEGASLRGLEGLYLGAHQLPSMRHKISGIGLHQSAGVSHRPGRRMVDGAGQRLLQGRLAASQLVAALHPVVDAPGVGQSLGITGGPFKSRLGAKDLAVAARVDQILGTGRAHQGVVFGDAGGNQRAIVPGQAGMALGLRMPGIGQHSG